MPHHVFSLIRDAAPDPTMPHTRSLSPATAVHLLCRVIALLFEIGVLIVLIYITVTTGYKNGVRYAGVSLGRSH